MCLSAVLLLIATTQPPVVPPPPDETAASDEKVLREARVPVSGEDLLQFLREISPDPMRSAEIARLIEQLGHEQFAQRRRAFDRLQALGLVAIDPLRQAAGSNNPEIARSSQQLLQKLERQPTEAILQSAIRQLARSTPAGAFDWIVRQLPSFNSAALIEAAIWAMTTFARGDRACAAELERLLANEDPIRRSAAAQALLAIQPGHPKVRDLLRDPDEAVRWRLGLYLARVTRDESAIPVLIELFATAPTERLHPIDELLRHLAGPTAPDIPFGEDENARRQVRDAWKTWWREQRSTIRLDRLDQPPEYLGYTLVLQVGLGGTSGEAVEYAADGRSIRWRVKNLELPIDAQFLEQENRLLVAEYNGNQVTERDLTGRIHQRWPITQPIMCQRLPNGNTLIASRNQLVEFNPKQEKVFALARPANDIVAAGRTSDGVYVFITRTGICEQVDSQGKVIRSFNVSRPHQYSSLDLSVNNRVLITHSNGLAEYNLETGNQEWMISGHRTLTSVQRLRGGLMLVSSTSSRRISELDQQGKVQREIVLEDQIPWRAKRR